jgi:hypothetical protein
MCYIVFFAMSHRRTHEGGCANTYIGLRMRRHVCTNCKNVMHMLVNAHAYVYAYRTYACFVMHTLFVCARVCIYHMFYVHTFLALFAWYMFCVLYVLYAGGARGREKHIITHDNTQYVLHGGCQRE